MPQPFDDRVRSSLASLEPRPDPEELIAGLRDRKRHVRSRRLGASIAAYVVAAGLAVGGLALLNIAFRGDASAPKPHKVGPAVLPSVDPDPHAIEIYERFGGIAFMSNRSGSYELYAFTAEGIRQLTQGPGEPGGPVWSPDGQYIAFTKFAGGRTDLGLLGVFDNSVTGLTNLRADEGHPRWTPDGRWVVFDGDGNGQDGILAVSVDSGEVTTVMPAPARGSIFDPALSSDGNTLYYSFIPMAGDGLGADIYSVAIRQGPNGAPTLAGEPELVIGGKLEEYQSAPSPLGDLLAYVVDDHIHVLDLRTGRDRQLTTGPGRQSNPAWSPDQRQILFTGGRYPDHDVYVINVDGSGEENLTGSGDSSQGAWQP